VDVLDLSPKMSESRDPAALSAEARELVSRMQADQSFCLDVAYQLLTGRQRVEQLTAELDMERRRVDACVRAMAPPPVSGGPIRRALVKVVPAIAHLLAGMLFFVLLLVALSALDPRLAERLLLG
jgi:hypothetical protein